MNDIMNCCADSWWRITEIKIRNVSNHDKKFNTKKLD